jgi:NADH-quinone oxidoreductase subunit A
MEDILPALLLLAGVVVVIAAVYGASRMLRLTREPLRCEPFLSGMMPSEHAVSRFHVRWYPITMIFLAFDMEMVFMYPWTLVVRSVGVSAVVEMFGFLLVLLAGVVYAWREGALRWT